MNALVHNGKIDANFFLVIGLAMLFLPCIVNADDKIRLSVCQSNIKLGDSKEIELVCKPDVNSLDRGFMTSIKETFGAIVMGQLPDDAYSAVHAFCDKNKWTVKFNQIKSYDEFKKIHGALENSRIKDLPADFSQTTKTVKYQFDNNSTITSEWKNEQLLYVSTSDEKQVKLILQGIIDSKTMNYLVGGANKREIVFDDTSSTKVKEFISHCSEIGKSLP